MIALFVIAAIVSKLATRLATYLVDRSERRRRGGTDEDFDTGVITGIRQRETAISLIETSVRYLVFALALLFSIVALSGAQRLQTIAGASFLAIIIGFAAQRFLTDVIAGPADVLRGLVPDRRHGRDRRAAGAGRGRVGLAALAARCGASPARSCTSRTRR